MKGQRVTVHRSPQWEGCDSIWAMTLENGSWSAGYELVDNATTMETSETESEAGLQKLLLQNGRVVWVQSIDLDYHGGE